MGEPPGPPRIAQFFKSASKNPSKLSLVREPKMTAKRDEEEERAPICRHTQNKNVSDRTRNLRLDPGGRKGGGRK